MDVLLLNASYEPLRIITIRRAMGMLLTGRAVMIEAGDGHIRSATQAHPVPLVVRLQQMVKIPFTARVPLNRRTLTRRDHGRCQVAGCTATGSTVDHIVPRSRGGRHEWSNVALMCAAHNRDKGDRLLTELGWQLKKTPRPPAPSQALIQTGRAPAAVWIPYLQPSTGVAC